MPEIAQPIIFTNHAADRINQLCEEKQNTDLKLRVSVTGGGCSGFQYNFSFEENTNDDDIVIENKGAKLIVDNTSLQFIAGSEVTFTEDLNGSQFVVQNPNASSTCGCGTSFSI